MSSKKPTIEAKTASEYLSLWCNKKIKFEDALIEFAKQHVKSAVEATTASMKIGESGSAVIDLDAYPLTNIV